MAQPGRGEIECRLPVGKRANNAGSPPDLAQNAFERIVSSLAWIALSIAAISRTLVEGTWLKMRYQWTMQRCQAARRPR